MKLRRNKTFTDVFLTRDGIVKQEVNGKKYPVKPRIHNNIPYINLKVYIGKYPANVRIPLKKLMADTFLSPPKPDYVVVNIDNNPQNCRLDNLKYISPLSYKRTYKKGRPHKNPSDDFAKVISILGDQDDIKSGKSVFDIAVKIRRTEATTRNIITEMLDKSLIAKVPIGDIPHKIRKSMNLTGRPVYLYYLPEDTTRHALLKQIGKEELEDDNGFSVLEDDEDE